jgi:hypothetical protein
MSYFWIHKINRVISDQSSYNLKKISTEIFFNNIRIYFFIFEEKFNQTHHITCTVNILWPAFSTREKFVIYI